MVETDYGIPRENQERFARAAELLSLTIKVRPSNPDSVRALRAGHLPKPAEIKAKTINELDTHLGFRPEDVGLVGYRKPDQPARPEGMDDATWARVQDRYAQRLQEYGELREPMRQLQLPVTDQQTTSGRRRFRVDAHGVVRSVHPDTGASDRAVTGDHDLFEFRDVISGEVVTDPARLAHAMRVLGDSSLGIMHPAHMNWNTAGPDPAAAPTSGQATDRRIKQQIIERHVGNEPLVVFRPGAPVAIENAGIGKDY